MRITEYAKGIYKKICFIAAAIFILTFMNSFAYGAEASESETNDVIDDLISQAVERVAESSKPLPLEISLDGEGNAVYSPNHNYFIWPYEDEISSYFGHRDDVYVGTSDHQGIDILAVYGDEVVAARSGVITEDTGWDGGYGLCVHIDHGDGMETLYAHNCELAVEPGDYVETGDVIAYAGVTGWSSGTHVHFEVRYEGIPIDPMDFLPTEIDI